jgi:O-acetyl-ADP-ribose deacetylase (regulator of RNase III)
MKLDETAKYMSGAGLQPGQVRMVGRAIKPKFLPELPRVCRMIVTDPVTNLTIQGTLTIDMPAQSKFKGVTKALGTKIGGLFVEDAGRS